MIARVRDGNVDTFQRFCVKNSVTSFTLHAQNAQLYNRLYNGSSLLRKKSNHNHFTA